MPATVHVDQIEEVSLNEEGGVIVELIRACKITGLDNASGDFTILQEALDALDTAGLTAGSLLSGFENLVLTNRPLSVIDSSQTAVRATLDYQTISRTWRILSLNNGFVFNGGTSLQQETTQLDAFGTQITVAHTFDASDPDFPSQEKIQGASASVLVPSPSLIAAGKLATSFPDFITQDWAGSINSVPWRGAAAFTWLCSNVTFEPSDTVSLPASWEFVFEFTYRSDGWEPQVVYIDERTGKPPPGLVAGVGFKQIEWYATRDFNALFPI